MNQRLKKSILLGVLPLCLANISYGVLGEEGGRRSVSPSHAPYLVDDAVEEKRADYSAASMSESESDWEEQKTRKPGQLGDSIFAKFGAKKVFRKHRPEGLETEKKSPLPGTIGNVRMDDETRTAFRDQIDEAIEHINRQRWGNSVKGQQAKYEALVAELTEDDLSGHEIQKLKTLTPAERSILEELGLSSGIESESEDVPQTKKQVLSSSVSEPSEEGSQKTSSSLDQEKVNAFREHVKRVAKETADLNWFASPKEQKNKFDALVTRLRTTFYRH